MNRNGNCSHPPSASPFPPSAPTGTTFLACAAIVALVTLLAMPGANAGDSIYGKVTEVKRADVVVFDYGSGSYEIHLAGIDVPQGRAEVGAKAFTDSQLLGKPARLRFEGRTREGVMVGRLYTDDPTAGIQDVGVELVRAGLAMPEREFTGYKYNETQVAMKQAQARRVGAWADSPPQRP